MLNILLMIQVAPYPYEYQTQDQNPALQSPPEVWWFSIICNGMLSVVLYIQSITLYDNNYTLEILFSKSLGALGVKRGMSLYKMNFLVERKWMELCGIYLSSLLFLKSTSLQCRARLAMVRECTRTAHLSRTQSKRKFTPAVRCSKRIR